MRNVFYLLLIMATVMSAQQKRGITPEDLWAMQRLGNFDLSADGKNIVFSATTYSMELNKGNSDIFIMPASGGTPKAILQTEKNESNPQFTPDGKHISYEFNDQIWMCDLDGGNARQLTSLSTGASGVVWSADGKKALFVSSVYPECVNDECNSTRDKNKSESKVKASVFTELMYRHWNDWRGEKRSHLFLLDVSTGSTTDLTLFSKQDVPPIALGTDNDYGFSPDGKTVVFTMNADAKVEISTNNDIWLINLADVKAGAVTPMKKISESKGNDCGPVYSPDGSMIAYTSMERAGFEADKLRLMIYDVATGKTREVNKKFDQSFSGISWGADNKTIYFTSQSEVYDPVYSIDVQSGKVTKIVEKCVNSGVIASADGNTLYFKQQRADLPYELFSYSVSGKKLTQLTKLNEKRLAQLEMNSIETFWSPGAGGAKVQSILLKPPFFDAKQKYPMIFLIHGGPQGNWNDEFHYRWNLQMFASMGYVVIAVNPRGSTGYGQKFVDGVSGDWGGKPYTDLMNAYDYAVKTYKFIDGKNTFAAGASYGGYMINWIAGHTDRFNALVSHAGVFNLESMYGTTEELWFTEWEFKGTPWTNRSLYEKFSPHRFIDKCKTPVMVVHGAYDFRVPEEQGFQLFTSLQRLGIESKFLYFPDETHFVSKPQNSKLWWTEIAQWYKNHIKK